MQYLMERPTPTLCRFRVTIDEERRGAARSAVMDMTPESDLEKNDIRAATMEWLVDDCIPEVLQQAGILPLSPVRLLPGKENSRQDKYSFSFEVEALPELDLPEDLSTLAVEVEEPLPDPREFRHAVLQAQRSRAVLHPVEEKRLPQDGDVLRLNISAEARRERSARHAPRRLHHEAASGDRRSFRSRSAGPLASRGGKNADRCALPGQLSRSFPARTEHNHAGGTCEHQHGKFCRPSTKGWPNSSAFPPLKSSRTLFLLTSWEKR